jgi:hypothetical protein
VDPSSSHYDAAPAKHTHIALRSTCLFPRPDFTSSCPPALLDLDPFSIISAGTGTLTRSVVTNASLIAFPEALLLEFKE